MMADDNVTTFTVREAQRLAPLYACFIVAHNMTVEIGTGAYAAWLAEQRRVYWRETHAPEDQPPTTYELWTSFVHETLDAFQSWLLSRYPMPAEGAVDDCGRLEALPAEAFGRLDDRAPRRHPRRGGVDRDAAPRVSEGWDQAMTTTERIS